MLPLIRKKMRLCLHPLTESQDVIVIVHSWWLPKGTEHNSNLPVQEEKSFFFPHPHFMPFPIQTQMFSYLFCYDRLQLKLRLADLCNNLASMNVGWDTFVALTLVVSQVPSKKGVVLLQWMSDPITEYRKAFSMFTYILLLCKNV